MCCIKSKGGYSFSSTGTPALSESPVSTSGMSSHEIKANMSINNIYFESFVQLI